MGNTTTIRGTITTFYKSHTVNNVDIYKGTIAVDDNNIPFDVSVNAEGFGLLQEGRVVTLTGELRSYKKNEPYTKLKLYVLNANNDELKINNKVSIEGKIIKMFINKTYTIGIIRFIKKTFKNGNTKSYTIPIIGLDNIGSILNSLPIDTEIGIEGRLQTRNFIKKFKDGSSENREICEVLIDELYFN